ncbi:MAG: NAD(P)-binding domain-containing protein [Planctomycetota bacterium]
MKYERFRPISRYARWLHTRWPAGKPEKLPVVQQDGSTNVPGVFVVGDLTGIPLLKLSVNAGARVVRQIAEESSFQSRNASDASVLDVAIIGGGTAGFAAAKEAERLGLNYMVYEASEPFSTIVNFPKAKPIYKYPTELKLETDLEFHDKSDVKEGLLEDLREQTVDQGLKWTKLRISHVKRAGGVLELVVPDGQPIKAHRVIIGIGRSGNYRKLGVEGEQLNKVSNRLHDPTDFCGSEILVVGGGDSAMETAISLATCGAHVTLSYRKPEFSRPKPENIEKLTALAENPEAIAEVESPSDARQSAPSGEWIEQTEEQKAAGRGRVTLMMGSSVKEIREAEVEIKTADGEVKTVANDSVFAMIGREPPLDFFRRSGLQVAGDRNLRWWTTLTLFLAFCIWMYHWKSDTALFSIPGWKLPEWLVIDTAAILSRVQEQFGAWASNPANPLGVLLESMQGRSFYYTLAYATCVVVFGIRRIKRRKTPYVKVQTLTLTVIQVVPLFLLPEFFLPWFQGLGLFDSGVGAWIANEFFPGESWWRAYGLILAWPLMAWNWFTAEPIYGWLVLGFLQTFVAIPAMIYFWGKGAYCGWICSCGALAETLGDTQRHKMPHGPFWNRFNMVGQAILVFAVLLMGARIVGWVTEPERPPVNVYASAARYDAGADVSRTDLWHTFETLEGAQIVELDDGSEVQVASVAGERIDAGEGKTVTTLVLPGDLSGSLNQNVQVVQDPPSAVYTASTFAFDYFSSKDGVPILNWAWFVDLLWAGVLGVGLYFWFSGRVWCRFACPLAALMHIYARFSRFRILVDKKKCISCNVCTSVCHQGIDIMNFANKGQHMQDPECVRCSACVQMCPTGVLTFGQINKKTGEVIGVDPAWLDASPVNIREGQITVNGKPIRTRKAKASA